MPPADTSPSLPDPTDTHVVVEAVAFPPGVVPTEGGRYCGRETCEMNGVGAHRHLDETVHGSDVDDLTPRVPYAGPIDLENR